MSTSAGLELAYRATAFEVEAPPAPFALRVDQPSVRVRELMAPHGVVTAAYVTAWNPRSEPTSQADNDAAHERLVRWIDANGYRHLDGWGRDPSGQWPPEKSVLILGIPRDEACALGREFGQNAIVFVGADAVPRLEMLV